MNRAGRSLPLLELSLVVLVTTLHLETSADVTCQKNSDYSVSYRNNSLEKVPDDIPINVRHLDLSFNRIARVPPGFLAQFPNLTSLDLSWNRLTSIDSGTFADMTSLECLDLTGNNISAIAMESFTGSSKIKSLWLNRNALESWSFNTIASSSDTLLLLDLSDNKIEVIGSSADEGLEFPLLNVLKMSMNKIQNLENIYLPRSSSITQLRLDGNQIPNISDGFFRNMSSLKTLNLGGNTIDDLSNDTCFNFRNLENLNLDSNDLTSVPSKCFSWLGNLQTLSLSDNKFQTIKSESFENLLNLEQLEISNCGYLVSIEIGAFSGLVGLRELRIKNNEVLKMVTPNMWGNSTTVLTTLVLDSNPQLRSLSRELVENLPSLKELSLQNLDFVCDCELRWIKESSDRWRDPLKIHLDNTTCMNHPSTNRTLLSHVTSEEMVCDIPIVVTSSVDTELPDTAHLQVTITKIGIPVITWTLPTGITIGIGEYNPSDNSSSTIFTEVSAVSSIMICTLNISNVTENYYGNYILTATNMAGNVSQRLVLTPKSREVDPDLMLQIQLTVALVCMVVVVVMVGLVCFINTHHSNGQDFKSQSLLTQPSNSPTPAKTKYLQDSDSCKGSCESESKSDVIAKVDLKKADSTDKVAQIKEEITACIEARENLGFEPNISESTAL